MSVSVSTRPAPLIIGFAAQEDVPESPSRAESCGTTRRSLLSDLLRDFSAQLGAPTDARSGGANGGALRRPLFQEEDDDDEVGTGEKVEEDEELDDEVGGAT